MYARKPLFPLNRRSSDPNVPSDPALGYQSKASGAIPNSIRRKAREIRPQKKGSSRNAEGRCAEFLRLQINEAVSRVAIAEQDLGCAEKRKKIPGIDLLRPLSLWTDQSPQVDFASGSVISLPKNGRVASCCRRFGA
jgi:hypothetical protein